MLKTEFVFFSTGATVGKLNFYPFLLIMDTNEYVELMLNALQNLAMSTEGSMTVALARELGNRVQRKFLIRRKIKTGVADKVPATRPCLQKSFNNQLIFEKMFDNITSLRLIPYLPLNS